VARLEGDIERMVHTGEILEIRGIGKGTASVLNDIVAGETPEVLIRLRQEIPEGVRELLGVPGLGPKRVRSLWRELGVTSLGELEYAGRENRLVDLPGFGPTSQQRVLESVAFLQSSKGGQLMHRASAQAESIISMLSDGGFAKRIELAGELRRGCEVVEIVDLVVLADHARLGELLRERLDGVRDHGPETFLGTLEGGLPVRVRAATESQLGAALVWTTGNAGHIEAIQRRAVASGFRFDEHGLTEGEREHACPEETDLYGALGLAWVPPELREGSNEVEGAARGSLPELVEPGDLLGALHNHTTDSDGSASVEEMRRAAARLGWSHIGVADHSPAAHYANGVTADRLRRQWRLIDEMNERAEGPRVVKGLEADILADGALDIPDGAEDGLEYVVASVHSSFRLSEEAQTERLLRAIGHPACRVLGHPTGRLLLARPGYAVDLDRVLRGCAEHGVAVEINASPYRLDLDWRWARRAIELGVPLAINPDAHSTEGLEDLRWGVLVARRAGATAGQVLNCTPIDEFIDARRR
jgi:DNA polymerase (family 10)